MHGDEGGFATLGVGMFAAPEPLWSFGPQSLPNAHFWLYGAAVQLFGVSIWSVRFLVGGLRRAAGAGDRRHRASNGWPGGRADGGGGHGDPAAAALRPAGHVQRDDDGDLGPSRCGVVVRFPRHAAAAFAAGALVAVGWYGYQAASIAPLIAAAGVLPLVWRRAAPRVALRQLAVGAVGFALVIAPLAYGFYLTPTKRCSGGRSGPRGSRSRADPRQHARCPSLGDGWPPVGVRFEPERRLLSVPSPGGAARRARPRRSGWSPAARPRCAPA